MLAAFTVTSIADAGPGTLRDAIEQANANPGADIVEFASNVSYYGTTIALQSQLPTITGPLTITGPGAKRLTIDAGDGADGEFGTGDGFRIFDINDGDDETTIEVTISGMTLTGGDAANADGYHFASRSGYRGEDGGAIRSKENLTIADSVITGNAAGDGSDGLFIDTNYSYGPPVISEITPGSGGNGGGVWVDGASLTLTNSRVTGNRAGDGGSYADRPRYGGAGSGGGIGVYGGDLTIVGSTISGNATVTERGRTGFIPTLYVGGLVSSGAGGGVFVGRGRYFDTRAVTIESSTITGNRSRSGGGVAATYGDVDINTSTISNNEALHSGGGVESIYGDLLIFQSTISGNHVVDPSGSSSNSFAAIDHSRNDPGNLLEILQSTISGNSGGVFIGNAGDVLLRGAVVAGNGESAPDLQQPSRWESAAFEVRYSLVGATHIPDLVNGENGNLVGTPEAPIDPRLGPLADNGGPTLTHALQPDSPARNAGDPDAVPGADGLPQHDQRGVGFPRVLDGRIDIGAFEGVVAPPAATGDFNADGVVDTLDQALWRESYGAAVDPYAAADGNGDGLIDAGDYTVWRDHYTPRDLDVPRAPVSPTIDGYADPFWASVPALGAEHVVYGAIDSEADASILWRAAWDDVAFYYFAEVRDDRLVRDSQFAFDDDGVELFFDPDLSRGGAYDGVDDTQFMLNLAAVRAVASPPSPAESAEGVTLASAGAPNGPGYTVEAAIPWSSLDTTPEAGKLFGFEVALQDDDDGGGIRGDGPDGRRQWLGQSNQAFFRPAAFGVAALSPRVAEPPMEPSRSDELQAVAVASAPVGVGVPSVPPEPIRPATRSVVRERLISESDATVQATLLLIEPGPAASVEGVEPEPVDDPQHDAAIDEALADATLGGAL